MKKNQKKVRCDEIKRGKNFKFYQRIYVKMFHPYAVDIKTGNEKFIPGSYKVIPVIVTIKVKEK